MKHYSLSSFKDVQLTGGFWKDRQAVNTYTTVNAVYDRFEETGRFSALTLNWQEGDQNKPHIFYDSDTAKWIEGAAYTLYDTPNLQIEAKIDALIDCVEKGMTPEGYFNSFYLTIQRHKKFTNRSDHELYCLGHFIEAAVAYYEVTGKDKLLNLVQKYVAYVDELFRVKNAAQFETPGHEEIELALVRLWQVTKQQKHLELAKYFIDRRGKKLEDLCFEWFGPAYAQDQAPVRAQREAEGHVVRFTYLFSAAVDIARIYGDEELLKACQCVWQDVVTRKMYITGGVGNMKHGEAFGPAYCLPNDEAYTETCASIGLAMMAGRLLTVEPNAHYADLLELQAYNGALAGVSLDGEKFFYENPLEFRVTDNAYFRQTKASWRPNSRVKVFDCSCCPPNILRFIASIGQYFYTMGEERIYVNLYNEGIAHLEVSGVKVHIRQTTNYPWQGRVTLEVMPEERKNFQIAVRLPGWCKSPTVSSEGIEYKVEKGYAIFEKQWEQGDQIILDFPMSVKEMAAHPYITADCGRVALMRGPLVYCLEEVENGKGLTDIVLESKVDYTEQWQEEKLDGIIEIKFEAKKTCLRGWEDRLYKEWQVDEETIACTAIPYFAWSNRKLGEMAVWIRKSR